MSVSLLGALPLGSIHVGLNGAVSLSGSLLASFDAMATGPFGLGAALSDLTSQLNGALGAKLQFTAQLTNPLQAFQERLAALSRVQANLAGAIALGPPSMGSSLASSISASVSVAGVVGPKVAGLKSLLDGAFNVKAPLVNLLGGVAEAFSAGGMVLLTVGFTGPPDTLVSAGAQLASIFAGGLPGITPFQHVQGVVMLTADPSVGAALPSIIKTS